MSTSASRGLPRRLLRRTVQIAIAAAVIVAWLVVNPPSLLQSAEQEQREPRRTSEIATTSPVEDFGADGTIVFETTRSITHTPGGIVTEISSLEDPIETGSILYRVDNIPTVAIIGSTPSFRTMRVDDEGKDVLQLETALVQLGYDEASLLNVDGIFTDYTASIVSLWQEDIGAPITGSVNMSDVVFLPEGLLVRSQVTSVGQTVGVDPILELAGEARVVEFSVPSQDITSLPNGTVVEVRLPAGTRHEASVTASSDAGSGNWSVTAELAGEVDATEADEIPVAVSWQVAENSDLTVVAAGAIRRLDTGVFVVEVVGDSDLDTELVPVQIGRSFGSTVELLDSPPAGTVIISP